MNGNCWVTGVLLKAIGAAPTQSASRFADEICSAMISLRRAKRANWNE